MAIVKHDDLPPTRSYLSALNGRRVITPGVGSKTCTVWEQFLDPGGSIPAHVHDVEETITFLSGKVEVAVGEDVSEVEADATVLIPEGVVHSIRNVGGEAVRVLAFFPSALPRVIYTKELFGEGWNSNSRLEFYRHFSTNPQGWIPWVFEQLDLTDSCRILELGCGYGDLWSNNLERVPEGWDITLSDHSHIMLQNVQRLLRHSERRFHFEEVNARSIPFEAEAFDAVIANDVFFYMADWAQAIVESQRVLKPGGKFYTTATGEGHLKEMAALVERFDAEADFWGLLPAEPFYLDQGREEVQKAFAQVEILRYEDELAVTDADALVDFALSTNAKAALGGEQLIKFLDFVERELDREGTIRITRDMGMVKGVKGEM